MFEAPLLGSGSGGEHQNISDTRDLLNALKEILLGVDKSVLSNSPETIVDTEKKMKKGVSLAADGPVVLVKNSNLVSKTGRSMVVIFLFNAIIVRLACSDYDCVQTSAALPVKMKCPSLQIIQQSSPLLHRILSEANAVATFELPGSYEIWQQVKLNNHFAS